MNKKKSCSELKQFLDVVSDERYNEAWLGIERFAYFIPGILGLMPDLISSSSNNAASNISQLKNEAVSIVNSNQVDMVAILRPSIEMSNELKDIILLSKNNVFHPQMKDLYMALEDFISAYTVFSGRGGQARTVYQVSVIANNLMFCKKQIYSLANSIEKLTKATNVPDVQTMEVYLSNVESLKAFSEKVIAVSQIYSQLAELLDISEADNPIIIDHLEYGSFWLKIGGQALILALFSQALTTGGAIIHNEYTRTGQLEQLDKASTIIEKHLNLEKELAERGYETAEMREKIVASSKAISRQAYQLLYDQPDIEINGKEVGGLQGDSLKQGLIEQSKTLRLEYGGDPFGVAAKD